MSNVLESIPEEERRRVLSSARRRRFGRREVVFHEGDPADTLHLIDKGKVAVRITTPLGDAATLAVLGRGEVVGEMAMLSEAGRRGATVVALEPTETLTLTRDQFGELRDAYPGIDRFLVAAMAARIRRTDSHLVEALFVPVDRRLLRRLVSLAEQYGDGAPGTEIPLTQDDLASLAGTSRATANRVLREAEEAGVVSLRRGGVTVLQPEELARRSR